jgi:predicted O-methyltransferase YrrM
MQLPLSFDPKMALAYIGNLLPSQCCSYLHEPKLDNVQIQPTVGRHAACLLELLIYMKRPKWILELGTSYGSTACILGHAAATYGGRVITIEINETLAKLASENIKKAGLEAVVEVRTEDARTAIENIHMPFGLILQDSHKEAYLPMLNRLLELLESRGVLVSDDVLFPVMNIPESVKHWQTAMYEYNEALRQCEKLYTVWLPIGDGIALSVKKE